MSRQQPRPATILAGRREAELLAFPSVRRMADILSRRCREPSWVRTSVAGLNRFRTTMEIVDPETVIADGRENPAKADAVLQRFAEQLSGCTESQVAALAMGPKLWYRLNGVPVTWRPLPGRVDPLTLPVGTDRDLTSTAVLLSLIGSGLHRAELLRLRIGDVGSIDGEGRLIPDLEAEPMAIQHTPLRGRQERITFLSFNARHALLLHLARRRAAGRVPAPADPLIAIRKGAPATDASIGRAVQLTSSLIDTASDVNLELCMTTGEFFRVWGMPGSRFQGPEEFNSEDFMEDFA